MNPAPAAMSPNGVVVGRYQGTVIVTVHGELDPSKVAHLRLLLTDLIDGQGNVSVVVDLQDATPAPGDPGGLGRFAEATKHAHGRHAVIVVDAPSARTLATRGGCDDPLRPGEGHGPGAGLVQPAGSHPKRVTNSVTG